MLKVQRFGHSVFVIDTDLCDLTLYGEKFPTQQAAIKQSDRLCQEIASGLPKDKLSIAADIEKHMDALRHLPPGWR